MTPTLARSVNKLNKNEDKYKVIIIVQNISREFEKQIQINTIKRKTTMNFPQDGK